MEQLKACYDKYFAQAKTVWGERSFLDGAWGIGASSKNHPCHMEFYRGVQAWVEDFLKKDPSQEAAAKALFYILQTSEEHRDEFTYWTLYVAHGLARPLVPLISPQYAARMRVWYEAHIRRQERMPVHKDLLKQLKKRERE